MSRFENPEEILLRKGSPEDLNESEEAIHKLLVPEHKRRAIKIEDFADLYSADVIAQDQALVKRKVDSMERGRQEDRTRLIAKQRGDIFEAVVASQIAESDWMGPSADVIVPSTYDDVENKVDGIVEFEREEGGNSHLALAVDVTESPKSMDEKFAAIKGSIENGQLSKIKYFRSKNFRGELSGIPRVVVGADVATVKEISDLIVRFKRLQKTIGENRGKETNAATAEHSSKEFARVRKEVAEHPLQDILLVEIQKQLSSFREYAHRIGKEEVVEHYTQVLSLIDSIIEEKGGVHEVDASSGRDVIFKMIVEKAEGFAKDR